MATHWVDPVDGDNANDGSTYALAKQTLPGVEAQVSTDADASVVLNMVNSGAHAGSNVFTDFYISGLIASQTLTVQGVDSSGNPALTTIEAPNVAGETWFMAVWRGDVICKNLLMDWTPAASQIATMNMIEKTSSGDIGDTTFEYCHFKGLGYGVDGGGGTRKVIWVAGTRDHDVTYTKCIFENMCAGNNSPVEHLGGNTKCGLTMTGCVILEKQTTTQRAPLINFGATTATNDEFTFTNNTVVMSSDPTAALGAMDPVVEFGYQSASTMALCHVHDNICFLLNGPNTANATLDFGFFKGRATLSPAITITDASIGYNVLYTDSDFPIADIANCYFEGPFDGLPDDGSGKYFSTDSVSFGSATYGSIFFDESSSYGWTPDGDTVEMTLAADLRIIAETTSGTAGAVPGALEVGATDYTIAVTADDSTPSTADTIVVTTLISNAGISATSVLLDVPVPAGLTYVSHVASAGTYDDGTDVWTLGNLADAASETLAITCTVDTDQQGNTINFVSTFTSGSPGETPAPTDTLPIVVNAETSYVVTTKAGASSPKEGETTSVATNIANTGVNATGVTLDCPVPSGTTFVSYSATDGTYDSGTGVWTVGNLNTGSVAILTLYFSIKSGQAGNVLTFTGTLLTGTPQSHPDTSDDSSSETFTIPADDPTDPGSPASVPFVDTLPIYTTDLKLDLNVQMRLRKNRVDYGVLRGDIEEVRWREGSFRCINVGTNLTTQLNLGGIQRGEYLIMDSTTQIQISVGNDTNLYFPAKFLVLGSGDFEQVHLKNTSTTVAATVHIGVTD